MCVMDKTGTLTEHELTVVSVVDLTTQVHVSATITLTLTLTLSHTLT